MPYLCGKTGDVVNQISSPSKDTQYDQVDDDPQGVELTFTAGRDIGPVLVVLSICNVSLLGATNSVRHRQNGQVLGQKG